MRASHEVNHEDGEGRDAPSVASDGGRKSPTERGLREALRRALLAMVGPATQTWRRSKKRINPPDLFFVALMKQFKKGWAIS